MLINNRERLYAKSTKELVMEYTWREREFCWKIIQVFRIRHPSSTDLFKHDAQA